VSFAFFATGALFALAGMIWGAVMAASGDFAVAPAHAHLNLIGWASMAIMGGFYALAGDRAPKALAWTSYACLTAATVIMAPSLALAVKGNQSVSPILAVAALLAIVGMASFLLSVLIAWSRKPAAA
jgi:hypothetical protein